MVTFLKDYNDILKLRKIMIDNAEKTKSIKEKCICDSFDWKQKLLGI